MFSNYSNYYLITCPRDPNFKPIFCHSVSDVLYQYITRDVDENPLENTVIECFERYWNGQKWADERFVRYKTLRELKFEHIDLYVLYRLEAERNRDKLQVSENE